MTRPAASSVAAHFRHKLESDPEREVLALQARDGSVLRLSWRNLLETSASRAQVLAEQGVRAGEVLPVMRDFGPLLVADFLGAILLGALPCVLAPPNPKVSDAVLMRKLHGMLGSKNLDRIVCDPALEPVLTRALGAHLPNLRCVCDDRAGSTDALPLLEAMPQSSDSPVFLQHSSGTSGVPKAVVVRNRQLVNQLQHYAEALHVADNDRIISWLPLYHDMGMVACLWGSLLWNLPSLHMKNFDWLLRPLSLVEAMAREGSTLCWLPNFAFPYLARAAKGTRFAGHEMASVRAFINCSEPVKDESFRAFLGAFASVGVRAEQLAASYAMAENMFAVTQTVAGTPPLVIDADREVLETEGRVVSAAAGRPTRRLVSSGKVVAGTEVRIRLADGTLSEEAGKVGEIVLRGDSMLEEYYANPTDTQRCIVDGWYFTGDIGGFYAGELFVIGRLKDMLIVAGRNVDPSELEFLVFGVEGVIGGRACCLGMHDDAAGTEEIHVVVETALEGDQRDALALACKQRIKAETDFQLRQVWCVDAGWLVKSTSGKIARNENRDKLVAVLLNDQRPNSD